MFATPCCYHGTNKGFIYITLLLLIIFTLTITLSIHGNSNMEVLTSDQRMSATTIFSLYFSVDQNVTRPSL